MPGIADKHRLRGILPKVNKLFSQSRALNALNWATFHQTYQQNSSKDNRQIIHPHAGDFDPKTTLPCTAKYDEEATIAFNRAHFHRQIYDAMSHNPLSALYSLAWSLCLHIEGQPAGYEENNQNTLFDWINDRNVPYPDDAEYLRVWFPLILLHRMTTQLTRLLSTSQENANKNDTVDLFTFEDMRAADERFRNAFRSVVHNHHQHNHHNTTATSTATSEDLAARQARYNADRDNYLSSPLFRRQCIRTPYGLSEIADTASRDQQDAHYQLHFIPRLADLNDKKKVVYNFKRYQAYEPMRIKAERALQSRFPHYHAKHGMYLESWLFGSVCVNEASTTPESNERRYVMYWQLQKSTMLWILVHALFALNATLNDLMLEDLLWFIAHDLDRFIECGLCHAHWTANNGGQFEWRQHEARFIQNNLSRHEMATESLSPSLPFSAPLQHNLDLALFFTHNAVQTQRINPATGLTDAALNALKRDYAYFAGAFIGCLVEDNGKHPKNTVKSPQRVPFRCSVYDFEYKRRDVCRTAEQLYLSALQTATNLQPMADDDQAIVTCLLALQRRQMDARLSGH